MRRRVLVDEDRMGDFTMNLRTALAWDGEYQDVIREKRNLAALLYAALLIPANARRFLELVECQHPVVEGEMVVYFEYAYLRDLWHAKATQDPVVARRVILDLLDPPNRGILESVSVEEFNRHFGVSGKVSSKWIQSPGRWSVRNFAETLSDNNAFLRTCRFKWAFNAKPDLVIHTSANTAVCVEAKLESGEGSYPTSDREKAEFRRRGLARVSQTELQTFALRDLLGIDTQFVFLVARPGARSATHATVTWQQAFDALGIDRSMPLAQRWLARL